MADVKACGRCGASIPQQEIIEGKAKLLGGRLVCAQCAQKAAAQMATKAAISLPDVEPLLGAVAAAPETPVQNAEDASGIHAFGAGITHGRKEVAFQRQPKPTGTGAVRVRTLDAKLTRAALELLDEQINTWLDESGYEVKFVTTTIGDLQGKVTEPHLIVNIWY